MTQNTTPTVLKIPRKFIDQDRKVLEKCFHHLHVKIRWNVRLLAFEISRGGGEWEALTDNSNAVLRQDILEQCTIEKAASNELRPVKMSKERWYDAARSIAEEVDPFAIWLDSLPPWDEQKRLDSLIQTCFKVDAPQGYVEFASRVPLIAAIRRTRDPGTTYHTMTVLQGPEGCGKSTYWSSLLPDPVYFSDDLSFALRPKERAESLLGKVIVENAELSGMGRAELGSLKAFLSRDSDHYRVPYGTHPEDHKRRCVMVGSTNLKECLPDDPAGNRRFVVIPVDYLNPKSNKETSAAEVKRTLSRHREQLWAEAAWLEADNYPIYPTGNLVRFQQESNTDFKARPFESIETAVEELVKESPGGECRFIAIEKEIFDKVGIKNPQPRDRTAIKKTLTRLGVKTGTARIDGKVTRVWKFPREV